MLRWPKLDERKKGGKKGIKQNERKGRKKQKQKTGLQRVLHLSYDRTDSEHKHPIRRRSISCDHHVQHRRSRCDDVSTVTATTSRDHGNHLQAPIAWEAPRGGNAALKQDASRRLTRQHRAERNKTKTDARMYSSQFTC